MNEEEAERIVLSGFAWMDREQRRDIIKILKANREQLDTNFPLGYRPTPQAAPKPD